jgi:hypothetical protein
MKEKTSNGKPFELIYLNVVKKGRWACFQSFTIADHFYILWETFNVT